MIAAHTSAVPDPPLHSARGRGPGPGIVFTDVQKRFGALIVLRRVTFSISGGECAALLGANGSGKTTVLKMAAGLVRPDRGAVQITGVADADHGRMKHRIGFVGHSTFLYDELTAAENLHLFARLYGLARVAARVEESLHACGLAPRKNSLVRTFSRGMRQRLSIARAMVHSPDLLLMDEPSAGLDRQGVTWLVETIQAWMAAGCTILMSTHGQRELLAQANRAVLLAEANIAADTGSGANMSAIERLAGEDRRPSSETQA